MQLAGPLREGLAAILTSCRQLMSRPSANKGWRDTGPDGPPGAIWHGRVGHGLPFLARSGISLRGKVWKMRGLRGQRLQ